MKRFAVISLAFVLALGLTIQPVAAKVSLGVDGAGTFQALSSQNAGGADGNEEAGFGSMQANIHLYGDVAQGVEVYSEMLVNPDAGTDVDDAGDVRFYQGYLTLSNTLPGLDVKLGDFELNFGNQHMHQSLNGDVMDNKLVGNPLVNPTAVQAGLELSGSAAPVSWSVAATNGIADLGGHSTNTAGTNFTDFTAQDRALAYTAKVWGEFAPGFSGAFSYYMNDQSKTGVTGTGGAATGNLFGAQTVVYEGLTNTVTPTLGAGQDVTAMQIDFEYEAPVGTTIRGDYGDMEDADTNGSGAGTPDIVWTYYDLELNHPLTPQTYVAARYGIAENDASPATEFSKLQVGAGHHLNENTVAKVEYVTQANESSGNSAEVSGITGEVGVSF